ncbi:ribonuclease H-like domain-containing protein [Tanacetum coccineum]
MKDDEAKDDEPTKKSGKRRKQMARKGLHTSVDKNDSEDSDEVGEQEESVTGTKIPINPVPVAMKTPSIATYKIIKQGEKGVYQIVREDDCMDGPEDEVREGILEMIENIKHTGSDEIDLKHYDLMYIIVNVAEYDEFAEEILRIKEEYDIWAMEMEHYLEYIDNEVWKVIQNGNSKKRISTGKDGVVRVLSPVTAAEIQAVEKERKAKNILLMAIPKEHMRRFHGMDDAKEIWEAIRTRFGGNANSKKMQKAVFKQQFEAFKISNSEGLEKGYDRFQQLLSQLEAHGAEVSTEDANHKFLRSLPSAWSNLAMTMRTNPEIDNLSIDDLYNNLRVFEQEIQGAPKPSSSAQNVAFVSQSKSSTNKVKSGFSGAYSSCTPSTSSTNVPEKEVLAGFADEVIYSLFAKQTEDLDLLHEDLEQIDDVDIEEMDINWQIAMIAIRMKKFYKKTGRRVRVDGKTPVGFDKKKLECFNCHNTGHFARECTAKGTYDGKKKRDSLYQHQEAGKQEKNQMGLLTMDDGIVNWGEHTEAEESNHALMAISSSNEVSLCSKTCIDSYNKLKTLFDEQMNQLGDQEAQILAYSLAVKKLEAQLVTSQKQQLSLNEKLAFQANEIHEKDEKLKRYRRIGMKAVKEKEQLQKTVDSWNNSSKNLWRLINSGMSSNDKLGLGFEIQSNDEVLSYEEEMNFSVFKCSKEDSIGKPSYNRFTKTNDFKGVPPPLSGDYTPQPQEEIDDALYVYGKKGPQKPEISVSDDNSSEHSTCQSNDSEGSCGNTSEHSFETESESLDEPNEMSKSRLEVTNEKDVSVQNSKEVAPSCVSHIKTPRQPLKENETHKVNRKSWNDMMKRELGDGVNTPGSDENRLKLYDLMYKIVNVADMKNSCCKDTRRRLEVLQIKNNLKNSIYNILRKLKLNTAYPLPSDTAYPVLSNTMYSFKLINKAYPLPLDTAYRSFRTCMTRSSTNKLFTLYKEPKQEFRSSRRHFKTLSLDELRSPDFNLFSDQEYSEEEEATAIAETMEQYMSKTRTDYGSGELRENTFSGSNNEDANEHIKKVLEIVDLFHVPNITVDQLMLRVFLISLTGAASRWLRNEPTGSIKTWEDLKTKFLNKYCPPGRIAKKMEEINNFQQEPDETLYQEMAEYSQK